MRTKTLSVLILLSVVFTSCFKSRVDVGNYSAAGKTTKVVTAKNHYLIYGLIPLKMADIKNMAAGSTNYTVEMEMGIFDSGIAVITGGLYVPVTVRVIK